MEIVTTKIQVIQVPANVTDYKAGDIFTVGCSNGLSVTTDEGYDIPRSHCRVLEEDYFKMPQLTRKQGKAIKDATRYYNHSYGRVVSRYVEVELYRDLEDLYEIRLDVLIQALYNGYEVVPTEDELIQEEYKKADKICWLYPPGSKERLKAEGVMEGIKFVLKNKNIVIEGINEDEGINEEINDSI